MLVVYWAHFLQTTRERLIIGNRETVGLFHDHLNA